MRARNWEDFVEFDSQGRMIENSGPYFNTANISGVIGSGSVVQTHPTGPTIPGSLGTETQDVIEVELVAGQTYTFAYRGTTEGGVEDPYLALFGVGGVYVTEDDDGGLGRSSQITYTATETGTHYLLATSWYHVDPSAPGYPDYRDSGDYTIVEWSPESGHDAGSSLATAGTIDVGTNYAYFEAAFDQDMYAVELTEGMVYTFTFNGGVSSGGDWDDEPGESIGVLALYDSNGASLIPFSVNYETSITFVASDTGTYYLQAIPYSSFGGVPGPEMTGGYTIDVGERAFSDFDPLESLNWDSASNIPTVDVGGVPTAYVYFALAGEHFGETEATDDHPPGTPMTTYGWEQHQIDAVMHALNTQYSPITGINYVITTDVDQATFRLLTTINDDYGARFYPQAANYGSQAGIGTFNLASGGFGADPNSLLPGGYSYEVILHEFGHAHGVAHPHDTGGGSEIMLGVTASQGSFGLFDLNQGVYTVMSYNSGWNTHPDGDRNYSAANRASGWNETLAAFDIAVLQARYGTHDHNTGDNVYTIADTQEDATYVTIWDTDGIDTIAYSGERDVHIDLLAATLDYSPTGGGVLSFAHEVWGGYTIANGVVIENATGGSGDDVLIGNSADNVLTGNNGEDVLIGRDGDDALHGGHGDDVLNGGDGDDMLFGGNGVDQLNGGGGNNILNGGRGSDVFVFTEAGANTIVGYERGEDIDLSGLGVTMDDVTVTGTGIYVDLEGDDDLSILFNTTGFRMADLIFADETESLASSSMGAGASGGDYLFA